MGLRARLSVGYYEALAALRRRPVEVVSYDIFETCLVRALGGPEALFLWLGRRLRADGLLEVSPEVFARLRVDAERRTFAAGLDQPATLRTIYDELRFSLWWSPEQAAQAAQAELHLETELLRAVEPVRTEIAEHRARGARVAFISDMYLSSDFLRERLEEHGFFEDGDAVYVSNEHTASKLSGQLYDVVAADQRVPVLAARHVGNHDHSDYEQPRRQGWRAQWFSEGNLNRYEAILHRRAFESSGYASALAGASRIARLNLNASSPHHQAIVRVATGVIAPFVIDMMLWLLDDLREKRIERVYFAARDGQLLHVLAQRLADRRGQPLECRYLMGSRQAWGLPSLREIHPGSLEALFPSAFDVPATLPVLLSRIDMTLEEFQQLAPETGLPLDQPLSPEQRDQLIAQICEVAPLCDAVRERSARARELALAYLEDEGMLDGSPFAFFDFGGGATLQHMLCEILADRGAGVDHGYYFALRKNSVEPSHGFPVPYWSADVGDYRGRYHTEGIVYTLEAALSGDHGSVDHYARDEDGVSRPVCTPGIADELFAWGLGSVRDAVLAVADALPLEVPGFVREGDLRPALAEVHDTFFQTPSLPEARAWGAFPMEDGWGSAITSAPLAAPLGPRECYRALRGGSPHIRRHFWHQAAERISSQPMRVGFQLGVRVGDTTRRAARAARTRTGF